MEPLVSILIPTYNRPQSLLKAIESCLHQTYSKLEIIITDNSLNEVNSKLISDLYYDNSKIKYYKNETNIGPILNWRKALKFAKGEFCVLLPDDDFFINCFYIEDAIKIVQRDNSSLVVTACCFGYSEPKIHCSANQQNILIDGVDFIANFWTKYRIPTIANLFSKEIAMELNAFSSNEILYSDIDLWLKMASKSQISYYNIPSVYYSFHSENIVTNMSVDSLVRNSIFIHSVIATWKQNNHSSNIPLKSLEIKLVYRYCNFICSLYKINIITFSNMVIKKNNYSHFSYYCINVVSIMKYFILRKFKSIIYLYSWEKN